MEKKKSLGLIFIILATIMWAISGNFGAYIIKYNNVTPGHLTMYRMFITGFGLLAFEFFKDKNDFLKIFKSKKDFLLLFWFSAAGLICMQYGYFAAIKYSNAATAVLIQNLAPFLVIIFMSFYNRALPSKIIIFALFTAFFGMFLLVTHGNINRLNVSPPALLFGLLGAFGFTNYNIVPMELGKRYQSTYIIAWSMLISSLIFTPILRPYEESFIVDIVSISGLLYVGIFGTLVPFVLFLMGSQIIGPNKASILALIEPVASTFIGTFFLGVKFTLMDFIAIGLIVFALFLISLPNKK